MRYLITLLSLLILFSPSAHAISTPHGETAPDFTLNSLDGKAVSLNKYKGSIVILIYWRPEQERSLMALTDGQDLFKRYKDKGVQVMGLTTEIDKQEELRNIVKEHEIDFPVLLDTDRQVFGDYGIRVYPSTVIIDRGSKLSYDLPGHSLTYKITLEAHLQYMLGEIDEKKLNDIISFHRETVDESAVLAERRYNLALKFTKAQLYEQAIEEAKKSTEAKPDIAGSHTLLGFLFLAAKEGDKAFQEFSKAVEIDPLSHDAKTGLGAALILKGDIDGAIKILTDAVISNPCPEMTYYELGRVYELKGEKDKSIEMYKKAVEKIMKRQVIPSSIK